MDESNEDLNASIQEYCDHGVPSFQVVMWLHLAKQYTVFNIWFN
jgi:hypothetical protein